ncbi:MAG: hypothetical protein K2Y27_16110 [Xanthobacteraceae bacterium]|nr:hypothetical protein [Xanthobacteraceae bacterium]
MNRTASLSIVASLALPVIPADTAFASEVGAKSSAQTLRKNIATKQVLIAQPGSDRMLNPQPLPPKDGGPSQKGIIIVGGKNTIGSDRMLNPQPLPPKEKFGAFKNYGSDRALNPQPLPPKATTTAFRNSGSDRALNPQPLPPKETLKLMVR